MGSKISYLAGLCAIAFLWALSPTAAAGPDLRLVNAAAEQDKAAVRALLKQRVDVDVARADGVTALLYAAHWNDVEMVDLLIRAGANVNAAEDHGVTPLARACENASVTMVEQLLDAGANPNAAQTNGLTPLMIAAQTGNVQVVKALLARGADVNAATTNTKNTPLMWAVARQHPEIVRALLEAGADVHASTAKGFTPLLIAARYGDIAIAKMLIAAGVGVNETGSNGIHALPFSIVSGRADFALFLLEQGADPNGRMAGLSAMHAAAGGVGPWLRDWNRRVGPSVSPRGFPANRRLPLVRALLARGADPTTRITNSALFEGHLGYPRKGAFETYSCGTGDLRGATPLWIASYDANGGGYARGDASNPNLANPSIEIMQTLLAAGADYRVTTDDGTTPLMVAAGLGRCDYMFRGERGPRSPSAEKAVTLLLDAGADVKAVNEADFTALHGAAFRGLNEVIQILIERGAIIDARDFRGRTPYRLAEGAKQAFGIQEYPETAEFLKKLGANPNLGLPGDAQERLRDVPPAGSAQQP